MNRPFLKICGLTRVEDALAAVAAGADALGFIFAAESPRRVDPAVARAAARAVAAEFPDRRVARVGVTVNLPPREAAGLVEAAELTALQAHGEESPKMCRSYPRPTVKAVRPAAGFDPAGLEPYREFSLLWDAFHPTQRGGTGLISDWTAAAAAQAAGFRILLAGGLTPENAPAAVRTVRPLALDFNSGVEREPGIKDPSRIAAALSPWAGAAPPEESAWPW